ncbi:MAG: hypothetical protein ACREM2_09280 [Vulcanimicrobiaceae bacterium]
MHLGSLELSRRVLADYEAAKHYLARDRGERRLFAELERANVPLRLRLDRRNDDSYDPATHTIDWDPYSALRTTAGGRQSPALGLGHEVDHAIEATTHPRRFARDGATFDRHYDNAEERRVIAGSERRAARTLGEGVRRDHAGSTYRVGSPVACDLRPLAAVA